MAAALKTAVAEHAADAHCIAGQNLGDAQRAAFDYHAGIVTERMQTHAQTRCEALLVQGLGSRPDRLEGGWQKVWEGSRPRERERFRLYVRR